MGVREEIYVQGRMFACRGMTYLAVPFWSSSQVHKHTKKKAPPSHGKKIMHVICGECRAKLHSTLYQSAGPRWVCKFNRPDWLVEWCYCDSIASGRIITVVKSHHYFDFLQRYCFIRFSTKGAVESVMRQGKMMMSAHGEKIQHCIKGKYLICEVRPPYIYKGDSDLVYHPM